MHRSILALALLITPFPASADDSGSLKSWVEQHPIQETFPPRGNPAKPGDAEAGKWMECLNSGLFPTEMAYLADALVAAGLAGDQARHRALTDAIAKVVSWNSSSASTHEKLSGYYPMVRTWLMIHTDPSRQKQPSGWVGMRDELRGLKLPPDAVARVMAKVLDTLDDSNWNKGLTTFQKLRFYIELADIEHSELQSHLFIHRWEAEAWSPLSQGSPKEVRDQLHAMLKDRPDRVAWASFLFSWAWGNHWVSEGERLDPEALNTQTSKWAKGFQQVSKNTWLEGLANAYVQHSDEPRQLVVYPLFEPAARAEFHHLPLGLEQQIATDYAIHNWLSQHPDQADAALACCMETIAESIGKVTAAPTKFDYPRHATAGEVGRAIAVRYSNHPDSCRALTNTLQKAVDAVFAQDLGDRETDLRSSFESLFSLLEKFAFLDERSKAAGK